MSELEDAISHVRANQASALQDLEQLCTIPSVSTLSQHKSDIQDAAEWLVEKLREIGLDNVQVMPTEGHPIVYGESLRASEQTTILIYGHYDVQPAEPIGDWISAPFKPTVRRQHLYARGASDMKGQLVSLLAALAALTSSSSLSIHVKVLIEGEEEIGSPHLRAFIDRNKEMLACDFSLNADAGIVTPDLPAIVYGLRGLTYFELHVYGPQSDLHSGLFGGAVHNPAQVLCELIAGMHDGQNRVALPGFYDRVRPLGDAERAALARLPYGDESIREAAAKPPALYGESGYTNVERIGTRPTLEINGLVSGFTAEGAKTVLPAKAIAKISMRLVPDQIPAEVNQQLYAYLKEHSPPTVHWDLTTIASCQPVIIARDEPGIQAASQAMQTVFGVEPVFRREGGTVPVVGMLQDILGVETVMMGFALPDDGIHGPNEKQHLPTFHRGTEAYVHFLTNVADANGQ